MKGSSLESLPSGRKKLTGNRIKEMEGLNGVEGKKECDKEGPKHVFISTLSQISINIYRDV
jgi:hypothetical protein